MTGSAKRASARRTAIAGLAAGFLVLADGAATGQVDWWKQEGWKTDFSNARVPLSDILSGGPPRDGIPSIDDPVFEPVAAVKRYAEREPVIELAGEGAARAYPLGVLTWHEIVNDVVDGRPVAVTYCPLCNASIVFDRQVDGRTLEFGTTGKLRNSDLVMYDRQTEKWWQQFTGEAIVGALAGTKLKMIPSRVTSLADFRKRHPEGEVLVPNDPSLRAYGRNPYAEYDTQPGPYPLFKGDLPAEIDPMERVVVVRHGGRITAVTLAHLRQQGALETDDLRLTWRDGVASALDTSSIAEGRDVGGVEVVGAADGAPVAHDVTFGFVVYAFHPDVPVLTADGHVTLTTRR